MNITLNLATRPYLELRPVYARLRAAALVLAVLALPMLLVLRTAQTRARAAEARVEQLESRIALLRQQQTRARALTLEGANAQTLTRAAFLNDLFRRKAFSWTATMSDLETTLPYGVQVQAIDPVVTPDGHVTIRMRITGARERAVDVVHNLERSRHFVAPHVIAEALANQAGSEGNGSSGGVRQVGNPSDVTFDILADYRPLPNSHPNAGRARAAASGAKPSPEAPALPQAQLTNPEPEAPRPAPRRSLNYHPAPPVSTGSLPVIPPPIGGRQ